MTRREFLDLRDLPDKLIIDDIEFGGSVLHEPVLLFEGIKVQNSLGYDLRVSGKYNPLIPSIVYNFRILDVGAICRYEVNSTVHEGTRTHKHALVEEEDPRRNLPTRVTPRPDLEGKTAKQVWAKLCEEAKIKHTGRFLSPERRRANA